MSIKLQTYFVKKEVRATSISDAIRKSGKACIIEVWRDDTAVVSEEKKTGFQK